MSGPRPKPTALKRLQGNPGHRPLNDDDLKVEAGMPEMPKGLPKAARREWKRMSKLLLEKGVLSALDGRALEGYCRCCALCEQLQKNVDEFGAIQQVPMTNRNGDLIGYKPTANPALSKLMSAEALKLRFLIEFGLSPASRSKLHVEGKPAVDPMEDFLAARPQLVK